MAEMTPKNHPSFQYDPDYVKAWEKIGKWSTAVPHQKMEVPDWRIYKIEGIKELEYVKYELDRRGLKNPWLRNDVWRFPPFHERNPMKVWVKSAFGIKYRGLKYGFVAAAVVVSLEYVYYRKKYGGYPPWISGTVYHLFYPKHH